MASRSALSHHPTSTRPFTRSIRKIILTEDVPNLGFKGEYAFVKPGYAFNDLVPRKKALVATDPRAPEFAKSVDVTLSFNRYSKLEELKKKQEQRVLEVFLDRLKEIKITFERDVSSINKNVAETPVYSKHAPAQPLRGGRAEPDQQAVQPGHLGA